MENFSLEEDDGNELFITQESREIVPLIPNMDNNDENDVEFLGVSHGGESHSMHYSDISDDEMLQVPSSQPVRIDENKR